MHCKDNTRAGIHCKSENSAGEGINGRKHLRGRSKSFQVTRRLVSGRQNLSTNHTSLRSSTRRSNGITEVKKGPVLLQLEQARPGGSGFRRSFSKDKLGSLGETLPLPSFSSYRCLLGKNKDTASSKDNRDPPVLAGEGVVQQVSRYGSRYQETTTIQVIDHRHGVRKVPTQCKVMQFGRVNSFWCLQENSRQLSERSRELIEASWRPNTESTYSSGWRQWLEWCSLHGIQGHYPAIENVLNFLSHLFEKQKEYRTINCSRSMLSSTINAIDGFPVGKHPMVVRLMRGIFNKRPPSKPLFPAWSISKVLELFAKWAQAESLSLKLLTLKCVMLLALATAKRASSLNLFSIKSGYFELSENSLVIQPLGLEKTTRPGHKANPISLESYKDSHDLCPVTCVRQYMKKTRGLRKCDNII